MAQLCEVEVTESLLHSDHFFIMVHINQAMERNTRLPPRWHFRRANWPQFTKKIAENQATVQRNGKNVHEWYNDIENWILSAAHCTIPFRSAKTLKHPVPRWNNDCQMPLERKNLLTTER